MMWYWASGYGWGIWVFGALMMLIFWSGLAALVVLLVRSFGTMRVTQGDAATETLRKRLAAGEISVEEFERIRKILAQ